jgi:enolase-phosphatase E1
LLDVEGTTSAVSFVYDVLFPYARGQAETFLREHWTHAPLKRALELMAQDAGQPSLGAWVDLNSPATAQATILAEVHRLMDADVKATGLKELQGLIWTIGYKSGQLKSHVFDDLPPALMRWTANDLDVRIYSSGSITAQKLFFAHTEHGNLLPFLSGHYDTTTGPKREAGSYHKIAADFNLPPEQILFLSDVVEELDAAHSAGLQTCLIERPGNAVAPAGHTHATSTTFDQIAN